MNFQNRFLKNSDIFFHIAAKAGVWGSYSEFYNANVIATRRVLKACKSHRISKFIYTSTPSVVFSAQSIKNGTENLAYGKTEYSAYAKSKAIAEKEVLMANSPGKFQTIALRPHLIWGKDDPHLLPRVIARHRAGKLKIVGHGNNQVDLTHIDNVTHAHICAMEAVLKNKHLGGKPYFIGQNEPVYLWHWLNELFHALELPVLRKKISFKSAFFLGSGLEKIWKLFNLSNEPPMTRFVACQLAHDHWFSNKSANLDLGYNPIKNMDCALSESIDWLKSL